MKTRYYKGPGAVAAWEVSAAEAQAQPTYTQAFFDAADRLDRTLLYDNARLLKVNYYGERNLDDTRLFHRRNYAGVPFAVWRTLARESGYVWEQVYSFSADGEPAAQGKTLSDERERELMKVEMDAGGRVLLITKYVWENDDDLRYAFEYDASGALSGGYDALYGDHASLPDIKESLPDSAFYEHGYNLPRAISANGIPPDPQ